MTAEPLRTEIDRGRTGDKVAFPDPSAAPLGTDDEAAGTPSDGETLSNNSARHESGRTGNSPGATDEASRNFSGELVRPKGLPRKIAIIVLAISTLVAVFVGFLAWVGTMEPS